jgi:hypothetical protein
MDNVKNTNVVLESWYNVALELESEK